MISIIISSGSTSLLNSVKENIQKTIGVPFEILSYDNAGAKHGICAIYNMGARKAKFDILCFMHEDLDIKTQNWGKIVLKNFEENSDLGVLGVVGSAYKSAAPTGWGTLSNECKILHFNYIQAFKQVKKEPVHYVENPSGEDYSKVVTVDGMWFCTTREIVRKYPFDEELFKGFHCYDLDFCFQVGQEKDIAVTFDVLMEHYSEGGYSKAWWEDTLKLHHKWKVELPRALDELSARNKFLIEKRGYRWTIERLKEIGYSWDYFSQFLKKQKKEGYIDLRLFLKTYYFGWRYFSKK